MAGEERGPNKGEAYGVASITQILKGVDFPCSKQDLIENYGDEQVHWTKDQSFKLKDCLNKVRHDRFNSMADLTAAIGQIIPGGKQAPDSEIGGEAVKGAKSRTGGE